MIVTGVLARLSSDFGLQFGEYTVFQHETQIFPRTKLDGAVNSQGYFDLDNMFVNGLPDDYHLQFALRLPSGMPPSVQLASPMNQQETWGLSYYVYAYVTAKSAVKEMLGQQPTGHMYWAKLKGGRKSSKVFLSFSKLRVADREKLTGHPSTGTAYKYPFLSPSAEASLTATASLDKPAYQYGDVIEVNFKLANPKRIKVSGIKISVKQLVTIKIGGDPKNIIKTSIGRYSFSNNREELMSLETGYHQTIASLKDAEAFSDKFKIRPHIDPLRYLYQLALEAKLPRSEQGTPILAPNSAFDGEQWALGGGLDRVRMFNIEYYINVHVDIPWSKDLIIKLPFRFVNLGGASMAPAPTDALSAPIFANFGGSVVYEHSQSGVLEELKDLRPVPGNLINFVDVANSSDGSPTFSDDRVVEAAKPQPKSMRRVPDSSMAVGSGMSLKDDVQQAKVFLLQLRTKLGEEQQLVLQNLLDSNSMLLRFDPRRHVLIKEFLAVLDEVVMIWLPQMSQKVSALGLIKGFGDLSLFDPVESSESTAAAHDSEDNVSARCLVQNIVGRLGMFHSQLVQYQAPRSIQETKLEALNSVVDDVELVLTKLSNGLHGKLDDSGRRITPEVARELITRIQRKALDLVSVIPFYDKFDEELLRLQSKITSYGMVDHSSDTPPCIVTAWGEGFDVVMEQMAQLFENISSLMVDPALSGSRVASLFSAYVDSIIDLLQNAPTLSDRVGVAVFWQWQYLYAIVDTYYYGGPEHRLILSDRQRIKWTHRIRSLIPPQWELLAADSNKLHLVGNRVIAAMQQLVDTHE